MPAAPLPDNELARLSALRALNVLDTSAEVEFDALVEAAALLCNVPISLISLVDKERQWFKANVGLPGAIETPRDYAFCAYAIHDDGIFEVEDASKDVRFTDNPLVNSDPNIRFYAGASLRLSNGERVGTLCVIDKQPQKLTEQQRNILSLLAKAAVKALENRQALVKENKTRQELANISLQLISSEKRFRTLSDSSPLGIFSTDANGKCNYTNTRWQEIYGLSVTESFGDGWQKGLHPDDIEKVFTTWRENAPSGVEFDMEFRTRHKDGAVRHVHSRAKPITSWEGEIIGFVGSVEDVTTQKSLALENSELLNTIRSQFIMSITDAQGNIVEVNDAFCEISKFSREELIGSNHRIINSGIHEKEFFADMWRTISSGKSWRSEICNRAKDGSLYWVDSVITSSTNIQGKVEKYISIRSDITEQVNQRKAIKEQHELLRVTLQSIGDAVITTDAEGNTEWLNPVAERMTGWSNTEAKGRPLEQVFHIVNEETRLATENPVATCLAQGKIVGLANHTVLISRSGDEFGIEDSAAPIRNEQGEMLGVVLVFHDVTEQRRLSGEMSYQATHDSLTGLLNRVEFETRLRRLLMRTHETKSQHALMFIDLDQFKIVNDTCGHSVGDQLLQQVSQILNEAVRHRDTLARLGGDEFGVILEHCTTDQAQRVAQQICDKMENFRFLHDTHRFRIGTSIGLVTIDNRWPTTEALMQAADTSCYAAKDAGRNRVHTWFDTDMAMRARHGEMQWTTRIERALDENRFELYAQRIADLQNDECGIHAEVLLRMIDLDATIIPPGAFLPAAERFHLASRIDRWVLRNTIQWLKLRGNDEPPIDMLCINLSGQSIGDRTFHRQAIELLQDAGTQICSKICLEITETTAVTNLADAALFIEQASSLGIRIALDDFGAGASSFGYLKKLSVDILKIDGQFIKDLIDDPLDDAAVRCFVDVARLTGLKTVAEFVDNPAVLARVRELGIDYAQGFLLHKPSPINFALSVAEKIEQFHVRVR